METKYYIGRLTVYQGDYETDTYYKFKIEPNATYSPYEQVDYTAFSWYDDGELEYGRYVFNGGEIATEPCGYQQITREAFEDLHLLTNLSDFGDVPSEEEE